jgi:hypothetical protein
VPVPTPSVSGHRRPAGATDSSVARLGPVAMGDQHATGRPPLLPATLRTAWRPSPAARCGARRRLRRELPRPHQQPALHEANATGDVDDVTGGSSPGTSSSPDGSSSCPMVDIASPRSTSGSASRTTSCPPPPRGSVVARVDRSRRSLGGHDQEDVTTVTRDWHTTSAEFTNLFELSPWLGGTQVPITPTAVSTIACAGSSRRRSRCAEPPTTTGWRAACQRPARRDARVGRRVIRRCGEMLSNHCRSR